MARRSSKRSRTHYLFNTLWTFTFVACVCGLVALGMSGLNTTTSTTSPKVPVNNQVEAPSNSTPRTTATETAPTKATDLPSNSLPYRHAEAAPVPGNVLK